MVCCWEYLLQPTLVQSVGCCQVKSRRSHFTWCPNRISKQFTSLYQHTLWAGVSMCACVPDTRCTYSSIPAWHWIHVSRYQHDIESGWKSILENRKNLSARQLGAILYMLYVDTVICSRDLRARYCYCMNNINGILITTDSIIFGNTNTCFTSLCLLDMHVPWGSTHTHNNYASLRNQ